MSTGAGKVACVTGASGYIASWLVKFLLQRGYTVKATVRDLNNPKKVDHLVNLDGAKERLQLFKADLLDEGSFDSAVEGCDAVFHTASPFFFGGKDPQAEFLDPAVKGTLNVLKSCSKSATLKRVVVTSSVAAVACNDRPRAPDEVLDETWFSDPEFCRRNQGWYDLSKTLAEEAAWKFAKENNIDLVTINPALVSGPLLQPELNTSAAAVLNFVNGSPTFKNITLGWIDVRDVANAHILAYENASANGRYILVERVIHHSQAVQILRDIYPTLPLPDKCVDDKPYPPAYQFSKERAKSLGLEFTPLEVSLKDTVESLREKGFAKF
ncbi:cinnamoyl-CoA reductase 1 [Vigna radiata var. radiata]|uniref:Cinnamoyl-CoA reductase 1 n=1 Tax=Vigna radiata var. radiata TaxID=3916 RepID=A0A1S3U195_VIGRR|nr:cinnamoyl-CoA reductase 1 [Vigna radiata var. radiata]